MTAPKPPQPAHTPPGAPPHSTPSPSTREPHTSAIYRPPYSYRPYPAPAEHTTHDGALHSRTAPPHPFIYKYLRYILYILEIYNICVYIMCIYISIGIYKISAAKKRANRTQKEYTHTAKARSRAIPQRRERTPPREARTQQHPTQHAADCRTILIQFFRRGVSPTRACSRFREHLRDFASFQKLHENRHQRSRGRLTLVICVIMTRDSARPPLTKPRGGLIFQGFPVAVPFPHSFTSSFQPSQPPSPPPT